MTDVKVGKVTHEEFLIELPAIQGEETTAKFMEFVDRLCVDNRRLKDIVRLLGIFNNIDKPLTLRIATPMEMGVTHSLYEYFQVAMLAKKHNLDTCSCSKVFRVVQAFESIKPHLPQEYLARDWYVYMQPLDDFNMSGDLFIVGMGAPKPVLDIHPYSPTPEKMIGISWIYSGRREGPSVDQPILFCK